MRYEEFDLAGVRTYPLASRKSKSNAAEFARRYTPGAGMAAWLDALPNILGAADFKAVVEAVRRARAESRGVLWGLGAHVIKTGVGPVIVDLMERGTSRRSRPMARPSFTTSSWRCPAGPPRKWTNRSDPAALGWPKKPDGC